MPRVSPIPQQFERRVDGIDYGVLDDLVGYALRRAQIAIYVDFERALGGLDMTPQRFSAMVVIAGNAGITQRDLGQVLGIARSGVVQLVHALEAQRWVTRDADPADARAWRLSPTAAGRAYLADAKRRVRAHDRRIGRGLDATERATLIDQLGRLGDDGP